MYFWSFGEVLFLGMSFEVVVKNTVKDFGFTRNLRERVGHAGNSV